MQHSVRNIIGGAVLALGVALLPQQGFAAEQSIAEIAINTDDLSTLVSLVSAAGLVETLDTGGPFTVFAPTNEAFAQLPEEVVNVVVGNPDILTAILTYHVVGDKLLATDVLSVSSIGTLQGESLSVSLQNGDAFVDDSQIIATDIKANNGVVHLIDTVLVPQAAVEAIAAALTHDEPTSGDSASIVGIASATDDLSTLVSLVSSAGLAETLDTGGPFTVFAPTNSAFGKLPERAVNIIVSNPDILSSVLTYHVVGDELFAEDVLAQRRIDTLQGESLMVRTFAGEPYVNFSKIVATDIEASNGVVHLIDNVLVPREARIAILRAAVAEYRASIHSRAGARTYMRSH